MNKLLFLSLSLIGFNSYAEEVYPASSQSSGGFGVTLFFIIIIVAAVGCYIYQHYEKNRPTETAENSVSDSQEIHRLMLIRDINQQVSDVNDFVEKMKDVIPQNQEMNESIEQFLNKSQIELKQLKSGKPVWKKRDAERLELTNLYNKIFLD